MCVYVCRQCSIQRVIILNGEIKGLQTRAVIQLSISRLISKQRRGMREGESNTAVRESVRETEREREREREQESERSIPVYSGRDVNLSVKHKGSFSAFQY